MKQLHRIRTFYETDGRKFAARCSRALRFTSLNPNVITVVGTAIAIPAAWLIIEQQFFWAAVVFLAGSLLDAVDGAVARVTGKQSPFGAFLDSTLDRVSEGITIMALGIMFARSGHYWALAACFISLAASYLVSYTRARAEGLGFECAVGFASRVERVALITAGLVFADWFSITPLVWIVWILATISTLTVIQRINHVRKAAKRMTQAKPATE